MIFCPVPGTPFITQGFGQNPQIYSQFGLDGHNGIDFGLDVGEIVYAPHDGVATIRDDGGSGFGLYLTIEDTNRKSILAHLSGIDVADGQRIYQGDPVCRSGNSGFSSGPHLHWTYKILQNGVTQNNDNGYNGAVDVTEFTRLWLDQDLHFDADYHPAAQPYLNMTFAGDVYLKNPARHA